MEDCYILNHDCIHCLQNIGYIEFKSYFHIKLIHKLFYFDRNQIFSLNICVINDEHKIPSNTLLQNLTSLFIKYDNTIYKSFFWNIETKYLQKLSIKINWSRSSVDNFSILPSLTYLKIDSVAGLSWLYLAYHTNLKYLNLHNVKFDHNSDIYFQSSTNLISLIRSMDDTSDGRVVLNYKNNSRLKYLKLKNITLVGLHCMTQLETKILENIETIC